jgi:hypothetical protein
MIISSQRVVLRRKYSDSNANLRAARLFSVFFICLRPEMALENRRFVGLFKVFWVTHANP